MKKLITSLAVLLLFISSQVGAETIITNDDQTKYWTDGYWVNSLTNKDLKSDVYGAPDIVNSAFTIENHALTSITIKYYFNQIDHSGSVYNTKYTYQAIAPGDWFFSIDNDSDWEYALSTTSSSRGKSTFTDIGNVQDDKNWEMYGKELAYNNKKSYIESFAPTGWSDRGTHPALANLTGATSLGKVSFSGWGADWGNHGPSEGTLDDTTSWYSATWTFETPFALTPGSTLTYGFALTCANDVLKGSISIPTPEPGTALLLGFGLLGLGAMTRKRR